ncbi:MAG: plastocyanin/azurin family copper-binding protein [Ilumatobacteraceae bacterium]
MTSRFLAPVLLAAALALSACGGGSGSSADTIPADADVTVRAIEGLKWDQEEYTATAGDVLIAAVNESSMPHNLYIVDSTGTRLPQFLDIPTRGKVQTETVKLAPGTYTLICTVPGHSNMKATLTVT